MPPEIVYAELAVDVTGDVNTKLQAISCAAFEAATAIDELIFNVPNVPKERVYWFALSNANVATEKVPATVTVCAVVIALPKVAVSDELFGGEAGVQFAPVDQFPSASTFHAAEAANIFTWTKESNKNKLKKRSTFT